MINPPPRHRPPYASRTSLHHHNVAQCWYIHVLVRAHEITYGRLRCVSLQRHDARGQCTLGQRVVRNDTQNNKGSVSSILFGPTAPFHVRMHVLTRRYGLLRWSHPHIVRSIRWTTGAMDAQTPQMHSGRGSRATCASALQLFHHRSLPASLQQVQM